MATYRVKFNDGWSCVVTARSQSDAMEQARMMFLRRETATYSAIVGCEVIP